MSRISGECLCRNCCAEIQLTIIVLHGCCLVAGKVELQAAKAEVTLSVRTLDKLLVDDGFRFTFLSVKDEVAYLVKVVDGGLAIVVVRPSTPKGFFVELELGCCRTTIDHTSKT